MNAINTHFDNLRIDGHGLLSRDIESCKEQRSPLEIVITTCPPYSYNSDGEFLFDGEVFDNPGLVAIEALKRLTNLLHFLERQSVSSKLSFAYADQETNDSRILETLNISKEEFKKKLQRGEEILPYYANTYLYQNGLGNLSSVDVLNMSKNIFTDEELLDAFQIANSLSELTIYYVASARRGLYKRMYSKTTNITYAFMTELAIKDIAEHIAFGNAIRRLRQSSNKKIVIGTMSIPLLSNYFNYCAKENGTDKVPVIQITQNY